MSAAGLTELVWVGRDGEIEGVAGPPRPDLSWKKPGLLSPARKHLQQTAKTQQADQHQYRPDDPFESLIVVHDVVMCL